MPDRKRLFQELYNGSVAYTLEGGFGGDGEKLYVDTGSQLFFDPLRDWSVAVEFNTYSESESKVIFSCFSEKAYENRGLMRGLKRAIWILLTGKIFI